MIEKAYDLGYFEGVRNIASLYHRCLQRIVHHDNKTIELRLDSERFVSLLFSQLEEAKKLRDNHE